jgi:hypothetical protein
MSKIYSIPISWESYRRVEVKADNLQEAIIKGLKQFLSEPDDEYIDDSFDIDDIIHEENPEESFSWKIIMDEL